MAQTAQIIQLKDASGINISPTTNIESLYYESVNGNVIQRKYIYSNFPVYVNYNNETLKSYKDASTDASVISIHKNSKLVDNKDNDIIFSSIAVSRLEKTNLRKIDVSNYNLSNILYNYESKTMFDSSFNDIKEAISDISDNIDASITDISNFLHVDISNNIDELNASINNTIKTYTSVENYNHDDLANLFGHLIPGRLYGYYYYSENDDGKKIIFILEALDSSKLSENVVKVIAENYNYDDSTEPVDTDKWVVNYDFNNDIVLYMKDEWNNEAPFDFRIRHKLYTVEGDYFNTDYCLMKKVKNNKICCGSSNLTINCRNKDTEIENNYIGASDNGGIQTYTDIKNCYIGTNNSNLEICGENNIIGNNNSSIKIESYKILGDFILSSNNIIGSNNENIDILGDNNTIKNNNCNCSIYTSGTGKLYNNIIYNDCSAITVQTNGNIIYSNCLNINIFRALYPSIRRNPSNNIIYQDSSNITISYPYIVVGQNTKDFEASTNNVYYTNQIFYAKGFETLQN